jgi:hypothetical protein
MPASLVLFPIAKEQDPSRLPLLWEVSPLNSAPQGSSPLPQSPAPG